MDELLKLAILPALLVGIGFLIVVALAAWVGERVFGYRSKSYADRLLWQERETGASHHTLLVRIAALRTALNSAKDYVSRISASGNKSDFIAAADAVSALRARADAVVTEYKQVRWIGGGAYGLAIFANFLSLTHSVFASREAQLIGSQAGFDPMLEIEVLVCEIGDLDRELETLSAQLMRSAG